MSVLSLAAAQPVGFTRGELVDGRYRLVEPLDDDNPPGSSRVWRVLDTTSSQHVLLDLVPTDGGEVCLEALLTRLGLDLAAVLDAGDAEAAGTTFVYVATELPGRPVLPAAPAAVA